MSTLALLRAQIAWFCVQQAGRRMDSLPSSASADSASEGGVRACGRMPPGQ